MDCSYRAARPLHGYPQSCTVLLSADVLLGYFLAIGAQRFRPRGDPYPNVRVSAFYGEQDGADCRNGAEQITERRFRCLVLVRGQDIWLSRARSMVAADYLCPRLLLRCRKSVAGLG